MHVLFDTLSNDHNCVRGLLRRILGLNLVAVEKRTVINHIREEFLVTFKAEKMVVFSKLAEFDRPEAAPHILRVENERKAFENALEETSISIDDRERWHLQLRKLLHAIENYIKIEEAETFQQLKRAFSKEQLDGMAFNFEITKQELMSNLLKLPSPYEKPLHRIEIGFS